MGCHFLLQCMKVKSESEVAQSCLTLSDHMDCSLLGSSSMGFSRQEYWSGVPLPSPHTTKENHYFLMLSSMMTSCFSVKCHFCLISTTLGFPCGSAGKESTCNVGDLGSIPVLGRSPGEGKDYPLLYFGLENSMDCIVHGISKSWTPLSNFHFHWI